MKTYSKFIAASFGLLMMALPSIASANIGFSQPANVQPAVLEQTAAPQPHLTLAYWHRLGRAAIGTSAIITRTSAVNSHAHR